MRKLFFKSMLLLCALIVGTSSAWGTGTYVKVTANDQLVSGAIYIIANSNGVATSYASKLPTTNTGYTESDGIITTTTASPIEFTLGKNSSGNYTFLMSNGTYLGYNSSTNFRGNQSNANDTKEQWTVAYNSTYGMYTIVNVNATGRHIGYSGSSTFGAYASMPNNAPATLYKKQAAVSAPTFSIVSGTYTTAQSIELSCATDGATIYYTVGENPADPTNESLEYTGAIEVNSTTSIKAIAIKGSDESDVASARYAIVNHAGNAEDPYDVTDAIDFISTLGDATSSNDVYVRGIISQIDGYSSNTITYWISDDGTKTHQMEIYKGKGLDGANFTASTDLTLGQIVTVKGKVKDYNGTPEFTSGNQIFLHESDLVKTDDIELSMATPSVTAIASNFFTSSSTGAYTYEIDDEDIATVSVAGVVSPVSSGSTTLTISQAADVNYKENSITINVIVTAASLYPTTIVVDPNNGTTPYNTPKVVVYLIDDTYDGNVTAVSDCVSVATVAISQHTEGEGSFTITPVAVGTAHITISAPVTVTCEAAENVVYTITITAPDGTSEAAPAPETILEETFNDCSSPGGNDGNFTTAGNTEITTPNNYTDNDGWVFTKGYPASECVKFGGSSSKGTATTPAFGQSGDMTITFRAGAWNSSEEQTDLMLSVSGGGTLDKSSISMEKGNFNGYSVVITGATASTKLSFSGKSNSKSRFYLDDVIVSKGNSINVTLNDDGYATFCSEYPLDFSDYATADYSAWSVTNANTETGVITFSQITGAIKGGHGILLKGTPNATITLNSVNSSNELSGNILVGCLAPTYVDQVTTYYALVHVDTPEAHSEFQNLGSYTGIIPAGKAYLDLTSLGAAPDRLRIVFEGNNATNIENIEANEKAMKYVENGRILIKKNGITYDTLGRIVK